MDRGQYVVIGPAAGESRYEGNVEFVPDELMECDVLDIFADLDDLIIEVP